MLLVLSLFMKKADCSRTQPAAYVRHQGYADGLASPRLLTFFTNFAPPRLPSTSKVCHTVYRCHKAYAETMNKMNMSVMNSNFRGAAAQYISKQHPITHQQVCDSGMSLSFCHQGRECPTWPRRVARQRAWPIAGLAA